MTTGEYIEPNRHRSLRATTSIVGGVVAAICSGFFPNVWTQEGFGLASLVLAILILSGIGLPIWVNEKFVKPEHEAEAEAKLHAFAHNIPQAVNQIIQFIESDRSDEAARRLREGLASSASSMVSGARPGRVCVWRLDGSDGKRSDEGAYLALDCSDGDVEQPRDSFYPDTAHGRAHIRAAMRAKPVVVQDVDAPPSDLSDIDPHDRSKRYGCFLLIPIKRDGKVHGTLTVDYAGTNHLKKEDGAMAGAIARLYEIGFAAMGIGGRDVSAERDDLLSQLGEEVEEVGDAQRS